jgi:hypothetical protein
MKIELISGLLVASSLGFIGETAKPDTGTGPAKISPPTVVTKASGAPVYELPTVTITGPTAPVPLGRLVSMTAGIEKNPANLYSVTYVWRFSPDVGEVIYDDNNAKVAFGAGIDPGVTHQANLEVICTYAQQMGDGHYTNPASLIATATFNFTTAGRTPQPDVPTPPEPGPKPPAPVPLPPARFGLAQLSLDWSKAVALDPAVKKAQAMALGNSFATAAAKLDGCMAAIAAGTTPDITNATQALAFVKQSNNAAVPTAKVDWLPWFTQLQAKLQTMHLAELADLRDAFNEISAGLKAAGS